MRNQNDRAQANLAMLEFVARKLGDLKNELVFLGGCTTALFVTDPVVPDIRTTLDIDCIVDVLSLRHFHQVEKRLLKQGFKKSMEDDVICRWRYDDMILDVMPTDEKILGFGNRWYKAAIKQATTYQLAEDLCIKMLPAPYFLATKLEAFKTRGKNDYLMSHDFEDIITVIDGYVELLDEVITADTTLKKHLSKAFSDILKDQKFYMALPGHLNYGALTDNRIQIILRRIEKIGNLNKNI